MSKSLFLALPDIKRIHVYVNGDPFHSVTNFIVHPRRVRNFEAFLKELTEKIRPGFGAIRNVYTPVNGSRVRDLEDLENNQRYVAAGLESFHHLRYIDIEHQQAMKKAKKKTSKPTPAKVKKAITKNKLRRRPYSWEPVIIYIYRNGDDVSPAVKLAVRRGELDNWEQLLLKAGEKLDQSGYVKRLYSLTGDWVRGPNGIRNGSYYVAVGGYESFKHVMYGQLLEQLPKGFLRDTPPRPRRKSNPPNSKETKDPPRKVIPKITSVPVSKKSTTTSKTKSVLGPANNTNNKTKEKSNKSTFVIPKPPGKTTNGVKQTKPTATSTTTTTTLNRTANRSLKSKEPRKAPEKLPTKSMDTKKNNATKENILTKKSNALEKKVRKSPPDSEDSAYISDGEGWGRNRRSFQVLNGVPPSSQVYYASATKRNQPKKVTMVDFDEDEGGIYKAKTQSPETRYAREVHELRQLPVELPIDEVEATEVGEERIERENDKKYNDAPARTEKDTEDEKSSLEDIYEVRPKDQNYPIDYTRVEVTSAVRTA